jgi:hypothetical protein
MTIWFYQEFNDAMPKVGMVSEVYLDRVSPNKLAVINDDVIYFYADLADGSAIIEIDDVVNNITVWAVPIGFAGGVSGTFDSVPMVRLDDLGRLLQKRNS